VRRLQDSAAVIVAISPKKPRLLEQDVTKAEWPVLALTTTTLERALSRLAITPSGFCACGLLRAVFWFVRNVPMPTEKHLRFDPTCGI